MVLTTFIYKIIDSCVEITTFIIGIYCFYRMFQKYQQKKSKESFYLMFLFLMLTLAPIFQFMDGIFYNQAYGYNNQYGYAIIVLMTAIANIFLTLFAMDVFFSEPSKKKGFRIFTTFFIGWELCFGVLGMILKILNQDVTIVIGLHFVMAMISYLVLSFQARKLAKRIEEPIYKKSILYISNFSLTLLAIYIFFILDSFQNVYTLWGVIGWSIWLIGMILSYNGFIKPMGLNKTKKHERLSENKSSSNNNTMKYLYLLIFYMALYEIFDSYTTSYYPVVVSYILDDFQIDISTYYVAVAIGSLGLYLVILIQYLCDRIGRKPMMITTFFGMGFASFLLNFSTNISFFSSALFLMFIFFSSDIWVIIISEEAPKEKRASYSYIVMLFGVIGVFVIPLFRALLTDPSRPHTWTTMTYFAWIAMPLSLIGFFIHETKAYRLKKEQNIKEKWNMQKILANLKKPFDSENRIKTFAFIIIGFVLGLNYTSFQTIEEFLTSNLQNNDLVSVIITVAGVGSLIVYGISGVLADRIGRKKVFIAYALIFIISISGLVFSTRAKIIFLVFLFVIGSQMGFWGCFSMSKLYCVECFSTDIRGSSAGLRSFAYAIGLTIGSLIASGLNQIMSLGTSYILIGFTIAIIIPPLVKFVLPETKGKDLAHNPADDILQKPEEIK